MKYRLEQLAKAQYICCLPCPRCGADRMYKKSVYNALSRYVDVGVCTDCGTDEGIRAFTNNPLPLKEWSFIKSIEG